MKIKLLLVASATLLLASCKGKTQDEKDAQKFCDCAASVGMIDMIKKVKENPENVDQEEMKNKGEAFEKCVDFKAMEKRTESLSEEEKKAHGEKMEKIVKESCPEIAEAMGM